MKFSDRSTEPVVRLHDTQTTTMVAQGAGLYRGGDRMPRSEGYRREIVKMRVKRVRMIRSSTINSADWAAACKVDQSFSRRHPVTMRATAT